MANLRKRKGEKDLIGKVRGYKEEYQQKVVNDGWQSWHVTRCSRCMWIPLKFTTKKGKVNKKVLN